LGSALVHGIYAADSRLLSVRAAFPILRTSEARGKGSVVWGELGPPAWSSWWNKKPEARAHRPQEEDYREWATRLKANAALFSFREGMETLVRVLVEALQGRFPNVTLRSGAAVCGIETVTVAEDSYGDRDRPFSFQVRSLPRLFFLLSLKIYLFPH
jgi:oxygen-dependent protoporphyrinogen oxidase